MFKCNVVFYTCASTRGVVSDLVLDTPSDTFMNSLNKFILRKGSPEIILSDNGRPFVADTTPQFASNVNIHWKFALAKAPWYLGFWERLIG